MSMRNFLYNYPIVTIILLMWMMAIVTFTVYGVFFITPDVGAGLASLVGAIFGLPTAVLGFVQWRLQKEKKEGS